MSAYMFLPLVLIALGFGYSMWARKAMAARIGEVGAPEAFHEAYAGYFHDLGPTEKVVGVWMGLAFTGPQGQARQAAGSALNALARSAVGVSTYTPNVYVALTSLGRVLVAEEYSEMGDRGNFRQVRAFTPGARATSVAAGDASVGAAPSNPFNPSAPLQFVHLEAPGSEPFAAWLNRGNEISGAQRPLSEALGSPAV